MKKRNLRQKYLAWHNKYAACKEIIKCQTKRNKKMKKRKQNKKNCNNKLTKEKRQKFVFTFLLHTNTKTEKSAHKKQQIRNF